MGRRRGRRARKGSSGRSGGRRQPRNGRPPQEGDEPADELSEMGSIEWGGELIWAVGFTLGGAPYGSKASDFFPEDLEAMGLDPALAAGEDPGLVDPPHEPDDPRACPF